METLNHGGSSILLFNYLNSLIVIDNVKKHIVTIVNILNAIPDAEVIALSAEDDWFITYSYFGYYSIGPGANEFK